MAGLTVLNPIHILPLSSPSSTSAPSSITSLDLDSSSLWDCNLLQPLSTNPLAALTSSTSLHPDAPLPVRTTLCDAQRRLADILTTVHDPGTTQPLAHLAPSQVDCEIDPAIPASKSHCLPSSPPPYIMHSPLPSSHHKTPYSSYRLRRTPKSTMSFKLAAPAPRIPLASVLQYWAAQGSPSQRAVTCGDEAGSRMDVDMDQDHWEYEYEYPQIGLGLMLGAGQGSQTQTRALRHGSHTVAQSHSRSQSRSRYSRRLRRLAPAPLQLATTPRQAPRPLAQGQSASPTTASAPVTSAKCQRTPHSGVFVDIPLKTPSRDVGISTRATSAFDPDCIPSLDLSASQTPSASLHSAPECRASISSAMASISTAPTSLIFPTATEYPSTRPHTQTNMTAHTHTQSYTDATYTQADSSSHIDLLLWRRTVSREVDSPLSPLRAPKSVKCSARSVSAMLNSPPASPLKSSTGEFGVIPQSPVTPGLPWNAAPPPLRRNEWIALPDLSEEGPPSPGIGSGTPMVANLRIDLSVEDLALRAEKCAETIARASLSLRSCSLLRDPEAIADLCENLRLTFKTVQRALDVTPSEFVVDGSDAKQTWYTKHWDLIDSLNKNLSLFYLLAHQVEDRPPRIHKLAPILDKLATYQAKFADLARRISLSYERLRLLSLRTQLTTANTIARAHADEERSRRRDERAAMHEGRARRRSLREEIRRVRGTIRAMRDRHTEGVFRDENTNMDVDGDHEETRHWKTW
ncbi:hypothetical protein L226DRAFT_470211 [Lentinus tigrinus ALCF2SS1-7]|uniref:uncharacterized protein n=1 Tax=Lentinus tigrinus ALCF2SS1-7 TaxID=1328758 RepID=UPI001165E5CC|nr:hypothetical protein L226DRAFT_470211 [Lentinus tigrinus ALCF2SS1-7]